ncbi:MAG: hypothetical protein K0Q79_1077 [Flavipsychrobacter sp.]|jgi:gliding motility-associated-like protein|nr:hypothetical protein [Flavipsychrobacter sp.]
MKLLRSLCIVFLFSTPTHAQNWFWARTVGHAEPISTVAHRGINSGVVAIGDDNSIYTSIVNWSNNLRIGNTAIYDSVIYAGSVTEINPQAIIVKYTMTGDVAWVKGGVDGTSFPIDIATDHSGNVYLFGAFLSDSIRFDSFYAVNPRFHLRAIGIAACNYFLLKIAPTGDIAWMRTGSLSLRSLRYHFTMQGGIAVDGQDNIYIASSIKDSTVTFGPHTVVHAHPGFDDIFIAKYTNDGAPVWFRSYGGDLDDEVNGIEVSKGRVYITGNFNSQGFGIGSDTLNYVGPPIMPGSRTENSYYAAFDTAGNSIWAKCSPSYAEPTNILTGSTGNIYITGGATHGPYMTWGDDSVVLPTLGTAGFLASVDRDGNTRWLKTFSQKTAHFANSNIVRGITITPCNKIWISGGYDKVGGVMLDTTVLQDTTGGVFAAEFDDAGKLLTAYKVPSGDVALSAVAADSFSNVYLYSNFNNTTAPFAVANDTLHLFPGVSRNIFLAKFTPPGGQLFEETGFCPDGSTTITVPQGYERFFWNTGSEDAAISVNNAGNFISYSYSPDCKLAVTKHVAVSEIVLDPFVKDISYCWETGINIVLDPAAPAGSSYLWSTDQNDAVISVAAPGTYWVNIAKGGCSVADTFKVSEHQCNCVSLPNAFTPNGDGVNDLLAVVSKAGCILEQFSLSVYNRWGNVVFRSNSHMASWDGTWNGIVQDMGVYMYSMEYKTNYDNGSRRLKGNVTLIK